MNIFPLALLLLAPAFAQVKVSRHDCPEAKELQSDFVLSLGGHDFMFAYASCTQGPYTERRYVRPDSYVLTIVTAPGADRSQVLLSKAQGWIGNFGSVPNAKLASRTPVDFGEAAIKEGSGIVKLPAVLRSIPVTPTAACDAAMGKYAPGASLMLLTSTQAFYYHEDCDICAQVDRCELKTSQVSTLLTAHSISCEDLAPYVKGQVIIKDCR